MSTEFSSARFIRTGGSVSFEERAVTADELDYENAKKSGVEVEPITDPFEAAERAKVYRRYTIDGKLIEVPRGFYSPATFDLFVMRRPIVTVSGTQRVETATLQASQLAGFLFPGEVTPKNFVLPGGGASAIPAGVYLLQDFTFRDLRNGYTDVDVTYRMFLTWELVKP